MSNIAVIQHSIQGVEVCYRITDGYFNATNMCKVLKKQWHDFYRLDSTNAFIDALSIETGIPVSEIVEVKRGGIQSEQGTWVHPQIAIHLAQWLSPQFAVKVSQWVFNWISSDKPAKIKPSRSTKANLTLDDMLNAGVSLETTLIKVTHTKQGDIINVNQLDQLPEPVISKKESTVFHKPSWIQIVEIFFDEIHSKTVPEEMRQNMLISKVSVSLAKGEKEQHDCLFFRISNLMAFFRQAPRFYDLINASGITRSKTLWNELNKAGVLAFNGKTKEKGIPIKADTPLKTRRVPHLVALDLVVLEKNYGIIMTSNKGIAKTLK